MEIDARVDQRIESPTLCGYHGSGGGASGDGGHEDRNFLRFLSFGDG